MGESKSGARVRAVAAEALDAVVSGGRSSDAVLEEFAGRVAPEDRSLLKMLVFGCLRRHWRLSAWLGELLDRPMRKKDSVIHSLLAVGLFQLTDTRVPDHAAVSQTVEAVRLLRRPKFSGLVNAILRRFQRENLADKAPASDEARYDHPSWMIETIRRDWPDDWEAILEANNDRAPMWLRVNSVRQSLDDYLARLDAEGIAVAEHRGVTIRLEDAIPVSVLPGFDDGHVSVQDAAAQLAAPWLLTGNECRVLDACAAPGGKSAHLLEAGPGIELVALDSDARRLETLEANLERLGHTATVLHGDASIPAEWWDGQPFDAILLDAPCSASGVIRRHPDIKLLRRSSDIEPLARLQKDILKALWPLLSMGGRLLYATCSVFAAENDAVTEEFVAQTPDAAENRMLQNNNIHAVMRQKPCGYQVLPGAAGTDGFYYACLEKRTKT